MLDRIIFTMLTGAILVSGCTHNRPPMSISNETFTTKITEDGIKLFVYQFDMDRPGGSRGNQGADLLPVASVVRAAEAGQVARR